MMSFLELNGISTIDLVLCVVGAGLCFFSYVSRLVIHVYQYKKKSELAKKVYRYSVVLVLLGYLGWGFWSAIDPVKMSISSSVSLPIGAALTVIGFGLFGYSELKRAVWERKKSW